MQPGSAEPSALAPTASAPSPATTTTDDSSAFKPVQNERQTQSGEALLVEAYAVIWIALMVFVAIAWRRTRSLEDKVSSLEKAIEKAHLAATPMTKRSSSRAQGGAAEPAKAKAGES